MTCRSALWWLPNALAAVSVALATGSAWAAPPPDEDALFGADEAAPAKSATPTTTEPSAADLGEPGLQGKENTALLTRDRLQIGAFLYLRNGASLGDGGSLKTDWRLSQNTLFDTYLDGRINDQVRAYIRPRILYNPLADVPPTGLLAATGAAGANRVVMMLARMFSSRNKVYSNMLTTTSNGCCNQKYQ